MGWFSSEKKSKFNWVQLTSEDQLRNLLVDSNETPVAIFKHSTRCSISAMALSRFENNWNQDLPVTCVYLDLLVYRPLSNLLVELTGVPHESPQLIVLKNNQVIYHASHNGIDVEAVQTSLAL